MQGAAAKNQPGLPYDDNMTLDYMWRTSAAQLLSIPRWSPPQEVAVYCFSVVANYCAGVEELPLPPGLPFAPFYIKWSHRHYPISGIQMYKRPCAIAEVLKSSTLQSWKHLEVAMKKFCNSKTKLSRLAECIARSPNADNQLHYEHCTVEFGVLFAFRQISVAADFAAESEFLFAEVKGRDGHWCCAYAPPASPTHAQVNYDKAKHILTIFDNAGYKGVDKRIDEFWKKLRLTVTEVATCSANLGDYHMSVAEVGNLNTVV